MLVLLFPLASTSASVGELPGKVTQTFIHKESEALITRPWLLYLPFIVKIGHGRTKKSQGSPNAKHLSPSHCHIAAVLLLHDDEGQLLLSVPADPFWHEMRSQKS